MARIKRKINFYRSGFEEKVQKALKEAKIPYEYETEVIHYTVPASKHKYTPDFIFTRADGTKLYVEAKGRFDPDDRKKMLLIKEQHPDIDIRLLFMRDQPIRKGSKTFYSMWCIKNNIDYACGIDMPKEWLEVIK